MAEFCLECFNIINETNDNEDKYIMSEDLDLCEGCGKWKNVVVCTRRAYYLRKYRLILFPFKVIILILYILWRFFIIPYTIYKSMKIKKKDASN